MSDNIKVVVKVRPLIAREVEEKLFYQWKVKSDTLYQIDQNEKDLGQYFTFDKVYDKDSQTCDVYNDIAKPIVEAATAGFNGTIFAYGQTSSGKTYTMTGTEKDPGIIPLAVMNLFEMIKSIPKRDFLVRVSFVEIYNETLIDLLKVEKKHLKIQDTFQGVKVDAEERVTSSPEEVLDAMKEGEANRQTAATNMNTESSRSHSIFQITIESREHIEGEEEGECVNVSQLNLVDLAGSERAGQTGATGLRFKEGTHINKSLSSLALVIKQLSEDPNKHVNYRDSKLTRILQNSLGGNAKTGIICAITPAALEETISTLQFANRAKAIKNKPAVNAVTTNVSMIQQLTKQLSSLKTELENKKSVEKDNHALQKQIASLQRVILNGFTQRSTAEILNPRRKLVQPRRVTISTLQSIQEDPVPSVKFCTPSLKYNPVIVPGGSDFQPIHSALSLPTLPEEPPRLITPPPKVNKKVNFPDEVIELDSDDDSPPDAQTCPTSPYHKCFESSKTPPCILRKNAKRAEKNLQDIVELTEREKIYKPDVEEVMKRLDHNATIIANLEDEMNSLRLLTKEKDCEINKLKNTISKAEEQIKMIRLEQAELDTRCRDYSTKLTDLEVSYETLKKKAKSREEELLSLLEEQVPKKPPESIGKISTQNENDISLINSEKERGFTCATSISQPNDLQAQLNIKDTKILELEATILQHEKTIISLQNISHGYESNLNSYKEQLSDVEKELSHYTSTADALNKIIETQNLNIESLNTDIETYKELVRESKVKLQQRDNEILNDSEIENLVASEHTLLATNENIKNLIYSLKMSLHSKNEEIKALKITIHGNQTLEVDNLKEELANKNKYVVLLTEEIQQLKSEVDENVTIIKKYILEKNDWSHIEEQLNSKLIDLKNTISDLTKKNEELLQEAEELKASNEELIKNVNERDELFRLTNKTHSKQREDMCLEIKNLENLILSKEEDGNFIKAKSAITKVQNILSILTGSIQNVPDIIDNFVLLFSTLSNDLSTLETIATQIKEQNKHLTDVINQCETEHNLVEKRLDNILDTLNETVEEKVAINESYLNVSNVELLENIKTEEQLNNKKSAYLKLNCQIDRLSSVLKIAQSSFNQKIESKDKEIAELRKCISDNIHKMDVQDKELVLAQQQKENMKKRDQYLQQIFDKSWNVAHLFQIENNACKLENGEDNVLEKILSMLDKITNHVTILNNQNEIKHIKTELMEAKKEVRELTEQNKKFISDIHRMETTNVDLYDELNKIQQENKNLARDLESISKLLELSKQQLDSKLNEMENLELKARDCKVQFVNLDFLMKEQMYALQLENINLKERNIPTRVDDKYEDDNYGYDSNDDSSSYKLSRSYDSNKNLKCPQSLLTLCCNKIADSISVPNKKESLISSSNSNARLREIACRCDKLDGIQLELQELKNENMKLRSEIEELIIKNKNMFKEHNEVQNEVKSLLDLTNELQKKVVNHRTNLSTLTATTYAENKSLSSQMKFLQHHHNRFYNVCQRDIPAFKKQLEDLLTLLKNDSFVPNDSIKRYSLPNFLEVPSALSNFKNDSTLDGDFLMLDTNVTLTTTGDTTLVGHDQTCFDATQVCVCNEVACQTIELAPITNSILLNSQVVKDNEIIEKVEEIKKENQKLREMVNGYLAKKKLSYNIQTSLTQPENQVNEACTTHTCEDFLSNQMDCITEIEMLHQKLSNVESEKDSILEKYNNLLLEVPSTDALVKKITTLETELKEVDKLKATLNNKNKDMAALQDENDSLSTQIMEAVLEVDELKKEQDKLKVIKTQLSEKCFQLQIEVETIHSQYQDTKIVYCHECVSKNKLISSLEDRLAAVSHRISRSFSDSDRTSSYNTICTLHSELHAGKEDCDKLKEDVTTIKNHLDRTNLSMGQAMDIDDSIVEPNIFSDTKDFESVEYKCDMSDIIEERSLDLLYTLDKADCFKYYLEVTGVKKEDMGHDIKIIDVMKMLYKNIIVKHGNEIDNLVNKLRDFEDTKIELQSQLENLSKQYSCKTRELQEKNNELEAIETLLSHIRNNISHTSITEIEDNDISNFKGTVLNPLDTQFQLRSALFFDSILNRFTSNLQEKTFLCSKLDENLRNIQVEVVTLNDTVTQLKSQLTEKENEVKLLTEQKKIIQEVNNAVALDIVKKEQELDKILTEGCQKLSEHNILDQGDIGKKLPLSKHIDTLFKLIIDRCKNNNISGVKEQNNNLIQEVTCLKTYIAAKDIELEKLTGSLHENESNLLTQKALLNDIKQIYAKKVQENDANLAIIYKLHEEINNLRQSLITKETTIKTLEDNLHAKKQNGNLENKITELLIIKENFEQEIIKLKAINQEIVKKNDYYAKQLEASNVTIKENKIELEALASEMLILKESVKDNINVIENLKQEIKLLCDQNSQVTIQLQEKATECSRLEMNIKTHEKTAEVQSRMIMRLQKQKEQDGQQRDNEIGELNQKCAALRKESDAMSQEIMTYRNELKQLETIKQSLEAQITELRGSVRKPRVSMEALVEGSRRRRQSILDSNRMFVEDGPDADDHNKMEAHFGARASNEDSFMDVDGNDSNRSTPMRRNKGRDSSQCKPDQDEESGSRPSSVLAARRRRQSAHDLHRSALSQTPSPHDLPHKLRDHQEFEKLNQGDQGDSELTQVRKQLVSCQEELEQLREQYKELDEECETCAQYLRERDEQCARLRREKLALEQSVAELQSKLTNAALNGSGRRSSVCDAAVNTDEDWANLHSVVVDRMSYDAEVEKNKKLTKTIEELRFKKQDLKNTIAKMQKALEKKSLQSNRELEATKSELDSCKEELEELKERYKDLDEECETCAEYLKEREEQCRKLKEAKNALEAKLKEYEEDSSSKMLTVRKKRQSLHDQNRLSTSAELQDAATEANDDILSYQVEKDCLPRTSQDAQMKELNQLKFTLDKVSQEKAALEQKLVVVSAHAQAYVATGSAIVQNQQLTDVMKENQKLKKMNAKLFHICKKRGKKLSESNQCDRENQDPSDNVT